MKQKCLVVGIILLFIGTCFIPINAQDARKSSSTTSRGNWLYVGGSGPGNYTKIQDAIDNAGNGDTVFVYDDSSPYFELLHIHIALSLIGENKETTVIDGQNNSSPDGIIHIKANDVRISGFTIQNFSYIGIFLNGSSSDTITNNIIIRCDTGVYSIKSSRNTISDNIFSNNIDGIELATRTNDTTVSNNYMTKNGAGIWSGEIYAVTRRNYFINNTIENNAYGILLYTDDDIIESNNISNNYFGIYADNVARHQIIKNMVSKNKVGIFFVRGGSNVIKNNNLRFNRVGVVLLVSSENEFQSNNFILNFKNAGGFLSANTWNHNYWNRPLFRPKPIIIWSLYQIIPPGYYHIGLAIPYPTLEYDSNPAILPN